MSLRVRPRGRRRSGFTLIELMVTVAILAIVATLALPSFTRTIASTRMTMQANEFIAALNLARSEAIKRSQFVTIRAEANGPQFAAGWSVFTDADGDGIPAGSITERDGTVIQTTGALAGRTTITRVSRSTSEPYTYATSSDSDLRYVTFGARGANNAGARAFFKVCDSDDPTIPGRIVQVSVIGKVGIDSTTESCAAT